MRSWNFCMLGPSENFWEFWNRRGFWIEWWQNSVTAYLEGQEGLS